MKIAIILRKLNVEGGTQRQGLSLANELRRRGHEIVIYTLNYSPENCYPRLLKNLRVETLKNDGREQNKKTAYYPAFKKTGIPEVLNENRQAKKLAAIMDNDFNILNPHDQVAYKVAVYYKKYKKNIPSVWSMNDLPLKRWGFDRAHGCDDNFHQPWYKHIAYRLFDFYDKHTFIKKQDAIAVLDNFNKELVKKYLNLNAFIARSGLDFEYFNFQKKTPPTGGIVKILTSGILMPHRRFEDTINALPILNAKGFKPTLTIVGNAENNKKYYARLCALIAELKLENQVVFKGKVTEEKLMAAYHENDIYIFQHHLQTNGLSPFEAVACGLPIVVSKTAGCHEVLTDKENALFINPKDPADIAEKISLLLTDGTLYSKIAQNGNAFARQNFSWQKYADGILEIMGKLGISNRQ